MLVEIRAQTPYYIIDSDMIDRLVDDITGSLRGRWTKSVVGYSFKTNNLPWVIKHMKQKGLWAEVVSSDEYHLAKELGYETERIIFNGPAKRKDEFIEAVLGGAIINIDSHAELNWLSDCDVSTHPIMNVGLRVNFCIEDYCPGESQCGKEDGRFGFSYETGALKEAIEYLQSINVPLSGLHLHCSSKTRSANIYEAIARVAVKIVNEYHLDLKFIDIGGGFFGGVEFAPSFDDYFSAIAEIFRNVDGLRGAVVVIEPGMAVVGAAIDYITTVVDTKTTKNNTFVVLDGSRIHIDPLMRKSSYSYDIIKHSALSERLGQEQREQILSGFTCMENDRFFVLRDSPLACGDQVVFRRVGAYTVCLSPQFIEFSPAIYAKSKDGIELVRHRATVHDFLALSD